MSEVEKQESQKTVVAFISGLLIGGLLVWVFSSSPENTKVVEEEVNDTTEQTTEGENKTEESASDSKGSEATTHVTGEGSITIADQKAGMTVTLGTLKLPMTKGWVVVRDFTDGVAGNTLGAARYSTEEGLTPATVELMRATTAGKTYQAVFFTNEGDAGFSLAEDRMVDGIATTFNAQ